MVVGASCQICLIDYCRHFDTKIQELKLKFTDVALMPLFQTALHLRLGGRPISNGLIKSSLFAEGGTFEDFFRQYLVVGITRFI